MEAVIDYNGELEDLSADPEMPPGLGKVTVYGGKFEVENKTRELRDVFRSVLLPSLSSEFCRRQMPFLGIIVSLCFSSSWVSFLAPSLEQPRLPSRSDDAGGVLGSY